jgi:hypothetical protein
MPVLLVSMDTDTAAYSVHVTDMANMWTESLDRKAICIRGWSENTTIDPSDTSDNMTKFLTSLQSALDPSHPSHDQTQLRLMRASSSDAGDDGLTLHITCQLPGLQPLKWPMHLTKSPSSTVATDLVLPLVQAHLTRHQEVESLIRILGQKDVVLNKLLDKLDALGTGLEHVFNPLSGKKKVSRAAAADKVPGLEPFSRRRWQSGGTGSEEGPNNTEALINEVFGGEGLKFESSLDVDEAPKLDQWWLEFNGASTSQRPSQRKTSAARETTPPAPAESMDVDDDDFQVQSTPPHLAPSRPTAPKPEPLPDDASTEDEFEAAPPPRSNRVVPTETRKPEVKKPGSRLGALGRKKQSTPARSPSPVPSPPKTRVVSQKVDDSETASDPDDGGETASEVDEDQPASSPPPPPKPVAKKAGLGRIGGPKPKQLVQEPAETLSSEAVETSEPPPTRPAPRKLGLIGKKKESEAAPAAPARESRGRSGAPVNEEASSQPKARETSRERADRKREELKRELEKKAAAGPAKKKRKF